MGCSGGFLLGFGQGFNGFKEASSGVCEASAVREPIALGYWIVGLMAVGLQVAVGSLQQSGGHLGTATGIVVWVPSGLSIPVKMTA